MPLAAPCGGESDWLLGREMTPFPPAVLPMPNGLLAPPGAPPGLPPKPCVAGSSPVTTGGMPGLPMGNPDVMGGPPGDPAGGDPGPPGAPGPPGGGFGALVPVP